MRAGTRRQHHRREHEIGDEGPRRTDGSRWYVASTTHGTSLSYLSAFWMCCGNLERLQIRHGGPDIETTKLMIHGKSQKPSAAILIHVSRAPETAAAGRTGRGRDC